MPRRIWIPLLIFALVAGGAALFAVLSNGNGGEPDTTELFPGGNGGQDGADNDDQQNGMTPPGQQQQEIPIEDVTRINLRPVGGRDAEGMAARGVREDTDEFVAALAVRLPQPPAGMFYQVWIARNGETMSLGRMVPRGEGYVITFAAPNGDEDFFEFDEVFVTLEQREDGTPESRVLEGSFE